MIHGCPAAVEVLIVPGGKLVGRQMLLPSLLYTLTKDFAIIIGKLSQHRINGGSLLLHAEIHMMKMRKESQVDHDYCFFLH